MPWKNGNPPLYTVWRGILHRCYNPKAKQYKDYGGRGITVCDSWRHSYKQFYADMGDRPSGLTIERKNNDGNYTPENCYWETRQAQQRNQRRTRIVTIEGKQYKAIDLAEIAEIKSDDIVARAKKGLSYDEVVSKERRLNLEGFKLGPKVSSEVRRARTHCKNGHEFTPENTKMVTDGKYTWRTCKACHREKTKRQYQNKKRR